MSIRRIGALVVFLIVPVGAIAQDFSIKEPRLKQLSRAYGFVCGQQASLEMIEARFPGLAKDVKEAWYVFKASALGESIRGAEDELSQTLGDDWPKCKEMINSQMRELAEKQGVTHQQATAFLHEVCNRAKGKMPEDIRAILLSVHPRYKINPALELLEGWKQTYRTKGHPKAKGVDFSISVPASWSKREGYRPNIIQFFGVLSASVHDTAGVDFVALGHSKDEGGMSHGKGLSISLPEEARLAGSPSPFPSLA